MDASMWFTKVEAALRNGDDQTLLTLTSGSTAVYNQIPTSKLKETFLGQEDLYPLLFKLFTSLTGKSDSLHADKLELKTRIQKWRSGASKPTVSASCPPTPGLFHAPTSTFIHPLAPRPFVPQAATSFVPQATTSFVPQAATSFVPQATTSFVSQPRTPFVTPLTFVPYSGHLSTPSGAVSEVMVGPLDQAESHMVQDHTQSVEGHTNMPFGQTSFIAGPLTGPNQQNIPMSMPPHRKRYPKGNKSEITCQSCIGALKICYSVAKDGVSACWECACSGRRCSNAKSFRKQASTLSDPGEDQAEVEGLDIKTQLDVIMDLLQKLQDEQQVFIGHTNEQMSLINEKLQVLTNFGLHGTLPQPGNSSIPSEQLGFGSAF